MPFFDEPRPHINTVSSFVRLLEKKGYADHKQGRNGGFIYFAAKPKTDYRRKAMGKLIHRFFDNSFSMVSQLVADNQIDAEQLRRLLDMVEKKNE